MTRTDDTNPQQFNGGDLEAEEAKLFALGTDDVSEDDGTPAALAAKPGTEAAEAAAAATTPVEEPAAPTLLEVPAAPAPPKDFEAAAAALEQQYDDGNLTILELQKEMRKLTLEEVDFKNAHADWERTKAAIEAQNASTTQAHEQAVVSSWDKAALAFEADPVHKEFLANGLRHKVMENAITHVEGEAAKSGEKLTDAQLLEKAYALAVDYTGWKAPEGTRQPTREEVANAAKDRGGKSMQTLGDMPNAHVESIRGDASFEALDGLPIDQLEVAFANMSKAQQEKYLASAPGATATGRE